VIARFLVGPVDSIRLDSFRVAYGIALAAYMGHWWLDDAMEWLTVADFHLSPAAAGSAWLGLAPLPLWALAPFGTAFFAVIIAFTLGWRLPWTAGVTFLFVLYVSHADPLSSFTPNNLFLAGLAVLTVASSGSYWRVGGGTPGPVSVWPIRILQATLILVYFTAGTCKAIFGEWLSDSHVLWVQLQGTYRTEAASWLLRTLPQPVWTVLQSLSLSFELLAPLLFMVRRFRPLGYIWGAGMHLGIAIGMNEFFYLSLQMVTFYVLFVEEETLRRLWTRVAPLGRIEFGSRPTAVPNPSHHGG